jgi:hypothetical protein
MADQRWETAELHAPPNGDQRWETTEFYDSDEATGAEQLVQFLNENRQGPGEASATLRHGSAGLLYLTPGSLGTSTSQTWIYKELPASDGTAAAVQLLNGEPRQGPGEASASLRGDGSVGLVLLAPGSQGTGTEYAWWPFEANADGAHQVVQALNENRLGPGQASVTARSDGSAAAIFLLPGSLGSTPQTWLTSEFATAKDAVDFLNGLPGLDQPGPGGAVAWLPGGSPVLGSSAVLFYLANEEITNPL